MANPGVKYVKIVPASKIKREVIEEEDEECVSCRLCTKSFSNDVALRNHAKMEHIQAYIGGDPDVWTMPSEKPKKFKDIIQQRTEELTASMEPIDLMRLASEDVSYIIIKSEQDDDDSPAKKKKRLEKAEARREKMKQIVVRKEKEIKPITGPFECLQPSSVVADGVCHQIFFSCCEYSLHFRDEHTRRRKAHRCQVCEKALSQLAGEDTSPYPCQVCDTGFNTNKELMEHVNTAHVKLKPFQCTICHKRFTQQGGVQQHMRMHTGDKPFPCTFCTKAFTQKSGLDQHLRIHTKSKPYRCVICDKAFCQSVHLKQHMRTHTNVSPFQCGICQKRFKQSSHLNYHLKAHKGSDMTEEQRTKFTEILGLIENGMEVVEVETEQGQGVMMMDEQEAAERSIQVHQVQEDSEEWTVKVIQNE